MFIGWREIRRGAGKFGLMVGVIGMLAFMVVALSSLPGGLQNESVSAVRDLPGSGLAVQADAGGKPIGLVDSRLDTAAIAEVWTADPGAQPLGIAMSGLGYRGVNSAVAVFGRDGVAPGVRMSQDTADALGVRVGSLVSVGGVPTRVSTIAETGMFAHSPVVEVPTDLWRQVAHRDEMSAMILTSTVPAVPGVSAAQGSARLELIPGYTSEHGSLVLIQVLLLAISAVVVGAFFAVWTGHRLAALAVVRAMGASRGYLLRDGLTQAAVVLGAGLTIGGVTGVGLAWAVAGVVPIAITASAVVVPVGAMAVLGLIGAALALRPLTSVDPLTALNR